MNNGLRDPDRIFPKNQANPVRKQLPRIIAGSSLIDQLVTRIFFQPFCKAEGEHYPQLPTKKGIGFSREHAEKIVAGLEEFTDVFKAPPIVSDVSGWEKSFSPDCAEITCNVMRLLCTNATPALDAALSWWSHTLLSNLAVLSDGHLVKFCRPRVQRSGNYLTTTSNGIARVALGFIVGSVAQSMGDDCFEWNQATPDVLIQRYTALGLRVRDVEQMAPGRLHFCSHLFYREGGTAKCYLKNINRTLYESAMAGRHDPNTDLNYLSEVTDHEDLDLVRRIRAYLAEREGLLRALPGHDEEELTGESPTGEDC